MPKHTSVLPASVAATLLAAGFLGGCGGSTKVDVADMAMAVRDLAVSPDLTVPRTAYGFVMDSFTLPMNKTQFTYNVDGAGPMRNQLGDVLFYLKQSGGDDPQVAVNAALSEGVLVQLLMLHTLDPMLQDDMDVAISGYIGKPPASTDAGATDNFSGTHHFDLDLTQEPTNHTVRGPLIAGAVDTLKLPPAAVPMHLPIGPGAAPPEMTLWATHLAFTVEKNQDGSFRLTNGLLHGGLSRKEIDDRLIPAVAMNLQYYVDHSMMAATQLLSFFDKNGDNKISVDEVKNNVLVSTVLTPDSDLFDADGSFNPNTDGEKDSVSLGVGFTAVGALFQEP